MSPARLLAASVAVVLAIAAPLGVAGVWRPLRIQREVARLGSASPAARIDAARALHAAGEPALTPLADFLAAAPPDRREAALLALWNGIDDPYAFGDLAAAAAPDEGARWLARRLPRDPESLPCGIETASPTMRALEAMGAAATPALCELVSGLAALPPDAEPVDLLYASSVCLVLRRGADPSAAGPLHTLRDALPRLKLDPASAERATGCRQDPMEWMRVSIDAALDPIDPRR